MMPIAIPWSYSLPKVPKAMCLARAFVVGGFLAVVLVGRAPGDMAFANGLLYGQQA
ncbi:MAG: hypothetical protein ACLTMP_06595 [Eggerthella lenta]